MSKGKTLNLAGVRFERMLPGPIEAVWTHLTDTSKLPAWFGDNSMIEPRTGGAVSLMGGHIRGVVTQWRPPTKLIYTWNVFGPDDPPDAVSEYPESYPTFELSQDDGEVRLTFTHFPVLDRFAPQNAMGWHVMLDILGDALASRQAQPRAAYTQKIAPIYGVDLSNLAR